MGERAQALQALGEANRVRFVRAQLKRDLRAGEIDLMTVLGEHDDDIEGMEVRAILASLKGFGKIKAAKLLKSMNLPASAVVRDLSSRRRLEVVTAYEQRRLRG